MMNNKVIKSGIWFTISNFIIKTIGFITTPIFTRLLTKEEFGQFNNFQTWISILLIITSLNLEASLVRAKFDYQNNLDDYVFSMMVLSSISTLFWFALVIIFHSFAENMLSMNMKYINAMFLYLLFTPAINLFQNKERFKYRYKWTVTISLIVSVGNSLLSVILVLMCNNKLNGRILGFIIPSVVIGFIIYCYSFVKSKRIDFQHWKYALPITLPFIPHLLSMMLLGSMDKVMIRHICGAEDVALYSLSYTVGTLISILITSVNNAYSPWLADMLAADRIKEISKVSIPYVFTFCYFAVGAVLITPEVLLVLGGRSYLSAIYVMPPVAAGCVMQFIYCMYVNIEQYEKKTIGMAVASAIAAIINYILNYIFIPKYGYVAAAYTTFIGYYCLLIMHIFLVRKIGRGNIYKTRTILFISFSSSTVIFLMNFILNKISIRYALLCIYVLTGLFYVLRNKEKIKSILKKDF